MRDSPLHSAILGELHEKLGAILALQQDQVRRIFGQLANGEPPAAVADRLAVSVRTVQRALRKVMWDLLADQPAR